MMYLIDTDISIFSIKGKFKLKEKFLEIGFRNCWLSEISKAELLYNVSNSEFVTDNKQTIEEYLSKFEFLPITHVLELFADEKAYLKKAGKIISDFDILIGVTAIYYDLTLVTHNTRHFSRLQNIKLEDWVTNN